MARYNILQDKAFAFAVRIVNLYKYLCDDKKEFVLAKQVLRSGTSIGANIEEAIGGQSDRDFLSKLSIKRNNVLAEIVGSNKLYYSRTSRRHHSRHRGNLQNSRENQNNHNKKTLS